MTMPTKHLSDALLLDYAAGSLTEGWSLAVATHLALCPACRSRALAAEAVRVMNERSITSLFVTDGTRPAGIIRLHDCLKAGVA